MRPRDGKAWVSLEGRFACGTGTAAPALSFEWRPARRGSVRLLVLGTTRSVTTMESWPAALTVLLAPPIALVLLFVCGKKRKIPLAKRKSTKPENEVTFIDSSNKSAISSKRYRNQRLKNRQPTPEDPEQSSCHHDEQGSSHESQAAPQDSGNQSEKNTKETPPPFEEAFAAAKRSADRNSRTPGQEPPEKEAVPTPAAIEREKPPPPAPVKVKKQREEERKSEVSERSSSKKKRKSKRKQKKRHKSKRKKEDSNPEENVEPPSLPLHATQYENYYPQYLTKEPVPQKGVYKPGLTLSVEKVYPVESDHVVLGGMNPTRMQKYLDARSPTYLTGISNESDGELPPMSKAPHPILAVTPPVTAASNSPRMQTTQEPAATVPAVPTTPLLRQVVGGTRTTQGTTTAVLSTQQPSSPGPSTQPSTMGPTQLSTQGLPSTQVSVLDGPGKPSPFGTPPASTWLVNSKKTARTRLPTTQPSTAISRTQFSTAVASTTQHSRTGVLSTQNHSDEMEHGTQFDTGGTQLSSVPGTQPTTAGAVGSTQQVEGDSVGPTQGTSAGDVMLTGVPASVGPDGTQLPSEDPTQLTRTQAPFATQGTQLSRGSTHGTQLSCGATQGTQLSQAPTQGTQLTQLSQLGTQGTQLSRAATQTTQRTNAPVSVTGPSRTQATLAAPTAGTQLTGTYLSIHSTQGHSGAGREPPTQRPMRLYHSTQATTTATDQPLEQSTQPSVTGLQNTDGTQASVLPSTSPQEPFGSASRPDSLRLAETQVSALRPLSQRESRPSIAGQQFSRTQKTGSTGNGGEIGAGARITLGGANREDLNQKESTCESDTTRERRTNDRRAKEERQRQLLLEAEKERRRRLEEERVRKLRENAPKPRQMPRSSWERGIAEGRITRNKHDYPTMNDIVSDWESLDSSQQRSADTPAPAPPPPADAKTSTATAKGGKRSCVQK